MASFAKDLESAVAGGGLAVAVPTVGPLVGLFVAPAEAGPLAPPTDYESARAIASGETYPRFFHAMLRRGVALAPGAYEVMFPGLAHDDAVLARVVEAAGEAAAEVSRLDVGLHCMNERTTAGLRRPVRGGSLTLDRPDWNGLSVFEASVPDPFGRCRCARGPADMARAPWTDGSGVVFDRSIDGPSLLQVPRRRRFADGWVVIDWPHR